MASFLSGTFLCVVLATRGGADDIVRYDGYQIIGTVPWSENQLRYLNKLKDELKVEFWMPPTFPGHPANIFASPEKVIPVKNYLANKGLSVEVVWDNLQKLIDSSPMTNLGLNFTSRFDWKNYYSLDTIHAWLKGRARKYNKIATVVTAGRSSERRELLGLRIAHKPDQPIVFVEAGIHAREWISTAVATWFIQQALNSTNDLIQSYEWHIFPSVNPDGYEYTQKDRLWRKSRGKTLGNFTTGVDLNRNWPFKWDGNWSYADFYPGSKPGSEPETQAFMSYVNSKANRTRVYISLHNRGQLLMYPWGYTSTRPVNHKRLLNIAIKSATKLFRRFGTVYKCGPIHDTVYPAFGNTIDYVYSINITYPFIFELRDKGKYGFLLPKEQIIPTAIETFDALTVILKEAKN